MLFLQKFIAVHACSCDPKGFYCGETALRQAIILFLSLLAAWSGTSFAVSAAWASLDEPADKAVPALPVPVHAASLRPGMKSLPAAVPASIFGLAIAAGPAYAKKPGGEIKLRGSLADGPDYAASKSLYALGMLGTAPAFAAVSSSGGKAAPSSFPPSPKGLFKSGGSPKSGRDAVAASFLGIPYRNDGTLDEYGEYTLFADPGRRFSTPGLNCSGLVLGMSRFLLGRNFTLAQVKRDRLGDSGPGSPHGEDWDFGWDLIMNISEGYPRKLLLPGGASQDPSTATGFSPRGYDLHSEKTWQELPARFRQGCLYLVSINVDGRRKGYGLQHYHVGLIHVDSAGKAWLYQTTGKGKHANRRDLKSAAGVDSFLRAFANNGKYRRMMLVLEVALPQTDAVASAP